MPPTTLPPDIETAINDYRDATFDAAQAIGDNFESTVRRSKARSALESAITRAIAEATARERAAVVDYVRSNGDPLNTDGEDMAECIEAGDHIQARGDGEVAK